MNLTCLTSVYLSIKNEFSVWVTTKAEGFSSSQILKEAGWDARSIPRFLAKWIKWDMYISSDIYLAAKRAKVKVHTFHGVSFKGRAYTPKVLAYDKLFMIGPYMLKRFIELGILKENDPRILKVGMPKLDALVDGTWTKEKACNYLGIDASEFTVLYAPTWGAASSLDLYGDLVVDVVTGMGAKLMVKLHDHSLKEERWIRKCREWMRKGAYIFWKSDIVPAMAASDILISDFSSVANEYLILNRPLIYLFVPSFKERYKETVDENMLFKTGILIEKPEAKLVEKAVSRCIDYPKEFEQERLNMRDILFYNPGRATKVAVNYIKELIL